MVCADIRRLSFVVALLIVIPTATLSAEGDLRYSDHSIEDGTPHTRFRDKRTLDFILHGLAQMLGYRLQRNNAQTSTTPPTPPTTPPTQPPKFVAQPTSATPSQIVFLSLSDVVDLKSKQTTTALPRHSADADKSHPSARHRIASGYEIGSHNNDDSSDYSDVGRNRNDIGFRHSGSKHTEYDRDGNGDGFSSQYFRTGYSHGKEGSDHGKDGYNSDKSDHHRRSGHASDKVDEYLERVGLYIKGKFRGGKNVGKEGQLKNDDISKLADHGRDHEWNKEHVKSEYDKMKGSKHDQDGHEVSEGNHKGDIAQEKEKEDTSKSDDDEMFNEAHLKPPENTKQKGTSTQNFKQEDGGEEMVEQEQDHNSTHEIAEKENVKQEHAHNPKQESDEKDTTGQKQDELSKREDSREEEKHLEGDYHNQIPAPSLQTWDEDFWNSRNAFADSNPYSFGLLYSQQSHTGEQNDLHKIPGFSFDSSSLEQDSKESKPSQPEHFYNRPQYVDDPGFEPVHEWHVTSDRKSEKPSSGSSIQKETSDTQFVFKNEQQETSHDFSDNPEELSDLSSIETPEPSKPPVHGQDITDNPPMPIHSTSKPKLAQLIHEMEGTKQNPLWPPPFDHTFESTDSSVATQHPKQANVTVSKKFPSHTSPFLLNLYNYTSISDYLLDLSKKNLLQKQLSQHSPQHTKGNHVSLKYKSPVSYVAVVIPNQSKNEHVESSDHSIPPEPSFVGVVYPQRFSSDDTKQVLNFTSTKTKSVKDDKTPKFKPFSKSQSSNLSQKVHHNDNDEIQDPPLETHYNSLYRGISSTLESTASSNTSNPSHYENIQKYPYSYFNFFHNPEIHSNSKTQLQSVNTVPDFRTSYNASQRTQYPTENDYQYSGNIFYNPKVSSRSNIPSQGTVLDTSTASNFSPREHGGKSQHGAPYYRLFFQNSEENPKSTEGSSSALDSRISGSFPHLHNHHQNGIIERYFDSHYDNPFFQNHGEHPNTDSPTEVSSSTLDSRILSNFQKEHIHDNPGTYYSSFPNNIGINTKTNASQDGSSLVLNSRLLSNSSGETYNQIQNGNISYYPEVYYSTFQNAETQPLSSSLPQNSYYNYRDNQKDKSHNPSPFYSGSRQQESCTSRSLRLVISDLQPYVSPHSQSSRLRVVIPDFPQDESSSDYSSGSEQNESKNTFFEEHIGLMTIPPPTAYSDEPAGLKNPEKWVLGDDVANTKNLKSKEYITRVSKVKVTGRVLSQPKANL
jgi:hypothetical protein